MHRYFLNLNYSGKNYNGWQIQANTPATIQQVIQEKAALILGHKIEITGCGRTDTGVNAKNYIAHFDSELDLIANKNHWLYKLNTVLPPEIAINDFMLVNNNAHARFDAKQRTYHYFIHQAKNPFIEEFSYFMHGQIDFELMNIAAVELLKASDFTSFSKLNAQTKTNNCAITKATWNMCGYKQWRFSITADRFLWGMVRAIVGTLLLVGRNKINIGDFKKIIELKDRKNAGNSAPAKALFLVGIEYPKSIYI
ncbi:MAG: tRNA pseudouridine(38-40) synthase TruA [Bacteroidetes bacterium]|nr:tRNA pseudouridine(38-40) synthase TruA [Bacteroidota bacterium]